MTEQKDSEPIEKGKILFTIGRAETIRANMGDILRIAQFVAASTPRRRANFWNEWVARRPGRKWAIE